MIFSVHFYESFPSVNIHLNPFKIYYKYLRNIKINDVYIKSCHNQCHVKEHRKKFVTGCQVRSRC